MAIKVTLREKPISKNRKSLYLDFYPAVYDHKKGKNTRREFLGMYIYEKAKSQSEKNHNRDTLQIAQGVRQKRENELNKPEIYSDYENEKLREKELSNGCFIEYFNSLAEQKSGANYNSWMSAKNYLIKFTNGKLKFSEIDEKYLESFKQFLLTTQSHRSTKTKLSQNSAASYFNKVKAALGQAFQDGILKVDYKSKVKSIKEKESRREYLTIDELRKLMDTGCNNPLYKRAAMFSALTGLRISDIKNLTWGDVQKEGSEYTLKFRQQKTKGLETHPISEEAYGFMGEPMDKDCKVFEGLKNTAYDNRHLYQWIGAAGITRHITFHCFRHTYATLQLSEGTDIYTVSKLLGHKNLKTTQIYAKVMDQGKRVAANKIKLKL